MSAVDAGDPLRSSTASTSKLTPSSDAGDTSDASDVASELARGWTRKELGLSPFLESSQLPGAVRSVFETGKEHETLAAVTQFRDDRSREIREVCDHHYQQFVMSIDELLDVRVDTMELKDSIVELNGQLQESGGRLIALTEELLLRKRQLARVKELGTLVSSCRHVWQLAERANRDALEGRFYQALRALTEVERALRLPSRLPQLELGRYVAASLPLLRARVRERAVQTLNQWLEVVRRRAVEVGKLAVDRTARRHEREEQRLRLNASAAARVLAGDDDEAAAAAATATAAVATATTSRGGDARLEPTLLAAPLFAELELDFAPLYQCAAVHASLGQAGAFTAYFTENRRKQAELLEPTDADTFFDAYGPYFLAVAGFFIVEATAQETLGALLPAAHVGALWSAAVAKLKVVLQEQLELCRSAAVLRDIKAFVVFINETLREYGLDVAPLVDVVQDMRTHYRQLARVDTCAQLDALIADETGSPLTLRSPADVERYGARHGLVLRDAPLPAPVAYSAFVPLALDALLAGLADVREFGRTLPDLAAQLQRTCVGLLDELAQRVLAHARTSPNTRSVAARVQLSVDVRCLVATLPLLGLHVAQLSAAALDDSELPPLEGTAGWHELVRAVQRAVRGDTVDELHDGDSNSDGGGGGGGAGAGGDGGGGGDAPWAIEQCSGAKALRTTAARIESLVRERMLASVDEFLSGALALSWAPSHSSLEPRGYAVDAVTFLEGSVLCMQPLSASLRREVLAGVFAHMGQFLAYLFCNDAVKRINLAGVMNLDVDLRLLEQFESTVATQQQPATHFAEARQLTTLLMSDDVQEFMDLSVQRSKYRLICSDVHRLLTCLEKWESKANLFSSRHTKSRKEHISNLLEYLRTRQ